MADPEPSLTDPDQSLADRILHSSVKSSFEKDSREFVPEGCLSAITEAAIEEELEEAGADDPGLPGLVEFIHKRAIKLFAIAVCITIEGSTLYDVMRLFKASNFSDERLPIKPWAEQHELSSLSKKKWNRTRISLFYTRQWAFLAPIFRPATERQSNYDFEQSHILPFTERYSEGYDRGSFGRVFKYKIHRDHLVDPEEPNQCEDKYVAVKEIQPPQNEEDRQKMVTGWEREASVLQKMNGFHQENIVRFITAFRHGDEGKEDYYLMFEWADGGNLRNLWKTLPRPASVTPTLVKNAVEQILGLATALCKAHYPPSRPTIRHGDLKPENILWFKPQANEVDSIGTLKIADWGLARQHNLETKQRSNKTSTGSGTRRYEPPEEETGEGLWANALSPAQAGKQQKKRSRLYDVWAMGCITLEFIVWLRYGLEGLRGFNAQIKGDYNSESVPFYKTKVVNGKKIAEVHEAVIWWMDHLAKDPACVPGSTALGSLLELVRERLLVIQLPEKSGTSTYEETARATGSQSRSRRGSVPSVSSVVQTPNLGATTNVDPDIPDIVISGPEQSESFGPKSPPTPIPLSERGRAPGRGGGRALSDEFVRRMEEIVSSQEEESYWVTEAPYPLPPSEQDSSDYPTIKEPESSNQVYVTDSDSDTETENSGEVLCEDKGRAKTRLAAPEALTGGLAVPTQRTQAVRDAWDIRVDNDFAARFFAGIKTSTSLTLPKARPSENLCDECKDLRAHIWDSSFDKTYDMSQLRQHAEAEACDLCRLIWITCQRSRSTGNDTVLLERTESYLKINGTASHKLSIFRSSDLRTRIDQTIQIGLGALPEAESEMHFEVIRQWLKHCDENHQDGASSCLPPTTGYPGSPKPTQKRLPTRVIEVGRDGDGKVFLRQTKAEDMGEWLALSHQWGPMPHFCTTTATLSRHLEGLDFDALPTTFRDAVAVTRALRCRYLWIDCLCIIQGDGGDFNEEAKRMEQVYSGAYCVLAISRAASHYAGFLGPRRKRDFVELRRREEAPFYICENIDDFNTHVLESDLSRRGWVLQEHALARRTVFFTDHQTYWECGEGVRCETMMKMKNERSAFLGDPNFPELIMNATQGGKIVRCQDLYKRYSGLGLTNDFDRPMAIDGLQHRILGALNIQGGFGVFDEGTKKKGLLRRSLLWIRAPGTSKLDRITFPANRAISVVPSWSWMAYTGAIDYISPDFGGVDWEELKSPWSGPGSGDDLFWTEVQGGNIALVGEAREYDPIKCSDPEKMSLEIDSPGGSLQPKTLCIILGRQKGVPLKEKRHYLLFIKRTANRDRRGAPLYERVGAGFLPGRCIEWSSPVRVTIH